jgi:tetratricopeptide (TPR) repeat protein
MISRRIRIVNGILFSGLLVWVFTACGEEGRQQVLPSGAEAISLLGDTLYTPELPENLYREYRGHLDQAVRDYRIDPEDKDAIIWLGRRLSYLGQYREAIRTFTEGIYKYPEEPGFYRHRGHRYITLRMFDQAVSDLETAVSMMRNQPDEIEPDGLPNVRNEPRSTLHSNVWYHLGLAHYLKGDYHAAIEAYRNCLNVSGNDDMLVATLYWYYMAEKRAGNDERAGRLLELVDVEMDVIENDNYHQLLLVFKGKFDADKLVEASEDAFQNATVGYGIGNWHYINGRTERAFRIWNEVLETGQWPAFGFIASETEIARRME